MAGTSKISAVFDANTTGFVAGTQRVSAALARLDKDVAGMRSSLGTLTAISGAQLFGSLVSVTSQAASGLIGMAKAAADSIDVLSKLAQRSGMAYEEIAGLQYAGDLAGVGIDAIGNALTKADKVFVAAGQGSRAAVDALAGIGLSFDQLAGMSSAERFQAISDALAGMPNTAERTAAAIALFGKSGAGLLPLFQEGAQGLQAMQAEAKKFGLGLNDLQGKNVEGMNDSFTRAGAAIRGVVTQVVANLAPGIERVVNMFANFVRDADGVNLGAKIADGLYQGADFLAGVADGMIAGLSAVWEFVSGVVGGWDGATRLFASSVQFAQGVFQAFEALGATMGAGLSTVAGLLLSAAADLVSLLPNGGEWEKMLRSSSDAAYSATAGYQKEAEQLATQSAINVGQAFGFEMGEAVNGAVAPAVGSIQQMLRDGKQAAIDAANAANGAGSGVGRQAGAEFRKAVEGVKIAAGIDARSSEGYSEFLRLKFGTQSDDAAERTADAAERTADGVDDLAGKLNFTVMGMV